MALPLVRAFSFVASAMAIISLLAGSVNADPDTIFVKNMFPFNRLRVSCDTQPGTHSLVSEEAFRFLINPAAQTSIACSVATELNIEDPRGDTNKSGRFNFWWKGIPLCGSGNVCLWIVGLDGVSITPDFAGNMPVHVYNWS